MVNHGDGQPRDMPFIQRVLDKCPKLVIEWVSTRYMSVRQGLLLSKDGSSDAQLDQCQDAREAI